MAASSSASPSSFSHSSFSPSLSSPSSSPSSSSPSSSSLWKYDVFLSFCGEDTRRSFVSHLYHRLKNLHIHTFKDDEELKRGEYISDELRGAIKESKIAITIISENYASSSWCLQELAQIMDSALKRSLTVIPIFYDVDPSDVRNLRGQFAEAFKKHEKKFPEDVGRWKEALTGVAKIVGVDSKNRNCKDDADLIEKILEDVLNQLRRNWSNDNPDLKGIDIHLEAIGPLLEIGSEEMDVRVIGLCGMGGIGKTTIAKYICGRFRDQFDLSCLYHVKKDNHWDEASLQKDFLSKVLQVGGQMLQTSAECSNALKSILRHQKVLIVLDDVDKLYQIHALAGEIDWFGPGSRIIITSREKGLFPKFLKYEIKIHEVECLSRDEAIELFCQYAFAQEIPKDGFSGFINSVIRYAGGLPLALKVLGSHLAGTSKENWESEQNKLEKHLHHDIMEVLKISYDGLNTEGKDIFRYIACFFREQESEWWERNLNAIYGDVEGSIRALVNRSLVDVIDGYVVMHDLLKEMGVELNRELSIDDPGVNKILTNPNEIRDVIIDCTGTKAVKAILLDGSKLEDKLSFTDEAFKMMPNLAFLIIHFQPMYMLLGMINADGLNFLPRKLVHLSWKHCPFLMMPSGFHPECLVELVLECSSLRSLWEGTPRLKNLKRMDLSSSQHLKTIAGLSNAQNLQQLELRGCKSLVDVSAIQSLPELAYLNLSFCGSLVDASSIQSLPKLAYLSLRHCKSLINVSFQSLPELAYLSLNFCESLIDVSSIQSLPKLAHLDLSSCKSLVYVSFRSLPKLAYLDLSVCGSLVDVSSIQSLPKLAYVALTGCKSLVYVSFRSLPELAYLDLSDCGSLVDVSSIQSLPKLAHLELIGCKSLVYVSFRSLPELAYLGLSDCESLIDVSSIQSLQELVCLELTGCKSLVYVSFRSLPELAYLDLSDCGSLVDVSSIQSLPKLTYLTLAGCKSLVYVSFRSLPELAYLDLCGCGSLVDVSSIQSLPKLAHLELIGCKSLVLPELAYLGLSDCGSLVDVSLIQSLLKLPWLDLSRHRSLVAVSLFIASQNSSQDLLNWLLRLDLGNCKKLKYIPSL